MIGISLLLYAFRSYIFKGEKKKMKKRGIDTFGIVIIALLLLFLIIFIICFVYSAITTSKTITIISKVNHIDYLDTYMLVHFSNGQVYRVSYPNFKETVTDFDQSKNVTIILSYSNLFWCTNLDNTWSINNIIKY